MRRSHAPSALNKTKLLDNCSNFGNDSLIENKGANHDDQYTWGSGTVSGLSGRNIYKNNRIFNIVWRDISNKKHKTWKGDGTLEVNNLYTKAILKDETGKYLGCSKKFNRTDLCPDFQMIVSGKEIEIQNEIMDEEAFHMLQKRRVLYQSWDDDECMYLNNLAEEKKPKGCFKFKPILLLKSPEIPSTSEKSLLNKIETERRDRSPTANTYQRKAVSTNSYQITSALPQLEHILNSRQRHEFLCFIRPSELQQFIFLKTYEYYTSIKSDVNLEKIQHLDIDNILLRICNHPSFINYKSTTNELLRYLLSFLPDLSEMGPFDSGKLEFIQQFLTDLTNNNPQNCIILAENTNVLNMLHGLCDYMNIKCLRLNKINTKNETAQALSDLKLPSEGLSQVFLVHSLELFGDFDISNFCKKLIIFEEFSKNDIGMLGNVKDIIVYYLVTAHSIEELLLINKYRNNRHYLMELLDELINIDTDIASCYLHTKIKHNFESSDENIKSNKKIWQHFIPPFDMKLLKILCLENCAENIVSIYYGN